MKPFTDVFPFGYCTNVHAGATLDLALDAIDRHATQVRSQVFPQGRLPVGLWLSESAAEQLVSQQRIGWLRDWLVERELVAYTFNGFPQGDFHQPIVKHSVYLPTWNCQSRANYTQRLAQILESILPEGAVGSISTLPLGWPHAPWHAENYSLAADFLLATARYLKQLSEKRGCELVLAIEPEPGCVLDTADSLVEFFEHYLFSSHDVDLARQHITVCHDICHSGVMFEPQTEVLNKYLLAGIRIGKVQVSSAIHVPWNEVLECAEAQSELLGQVATLNEAKYLHQTTACDEHWKLQFIDEDLPTAVRRCSDNRFPEHPWRIHFHVPIYVDRFGMLATTQSDIEQACKFLQSHRGMSVEGRDWFSGHYEVETYAWPVLPPELAVNDLSLGIAKELEYFNQLLTRVSKVQH